LIDAKQFLADGKHIAEFIQEERKKRDDFVASGGDFPFKFGGAWYEDEFEKQFN